MFFFKKNSYSLPATVLITLINYFRWKYYVNYGWLGKSESCDKSE